jgi:hypothetical protein
LIFKSLCSKEVLHLLCVSILSSWSLGGRWRFLTGVYMDSDIMNGLVTYLCCCILIFKSLCSQEVIHLLCVSILSSWSLGGRWRFLTGVYMDSDVINSLVTYLCCCILIFKSLCSQEVIHLLCVSILSSWSLGGRWRFLTGV